MVVDQVLAPETCYLSEIIRRLLLEQAVFVGMRAELLYTVNSPSKLLEFQELIRREPSLCPRRTRFCFGFDRTLVTYPRVHGDYSTVEPIKHMIDLVRAAYFDCAGERSGQYGAAGCVNSPVWRLRDGFCKDYERFEK